MYCRPVFSAALDLAGLKLPTQLGGTSITFEGIPAPLFFSSSGQVTFQVPFELAGKTSSQMTIRVDGETSATATVPLQDAARRAYLQWVRTTLELSC